LEKAGGKRTDLQPIPTSGKKSKNETLKDAGLSTSTAQRRIGEISRELEKAEAHGGKIRLPNSGKPKSQTLKDAGLSTSTAQRCEEIASVPEAKFEITRRHVNLS